MIRRPTTTTLFPYTTLFRSDQSTFIKGMIEGLLQLEKGDKAYIFIPSELGYGDRALGPIPANSDLVFYVDRSEEHTSELQSRPHLVCRLLLEKKKHNCSKWK